MARREYKGNAARTTLSADITAVSTTFSGANFTNWPTGAGGNFFVIIDRGLSGEEKILCSSRSGNTITVAGGGRGSDDTSAAAHTAGAFIEHGLTKTDADEANDHKNTTTLDDHTQYLNNARHDVEARHTFGAALGTAQAGADVTVTAGIAGVGANPAREDHTHKGTGTLGYAQVTANQTGITAEVDLTGLSVTVTVATSRRIKITGECLAQNSASGNVHALRIKEGTTQLQSRQLVSGAANSDESFHAEIPLTPTAGSHTYKLAFVAATGTSQLTAASTFPAFILVEDIGV